VRIRLSLSVHLATGATPGEPASEIRRLGIVQSIMLGLNRSPAAVRLLSTLAAQETAEDGRRVGGALRA